MPTMWWEQRNNGRGRKQEIYRPTWTALTGPYSERHNWWVSTQTLCLLLLLFAYKWLHLPKLCKDPQVCRWHSCCWSDPGWGQGTQKHVWLKSCYSYNCLELSTLKTVSITIEWESPYPSVAWCEQYSSDDYDSCISSTCHRVSWSSPTVLSLSLSSHHPSLPGVVRQMFRTFRGCSASSVQPKQSSVANCPIDQPFSTTAEQLAGKIIYDPSHPRCGRFESLPSGEKLIQTSLNRHRNSFCFFFLEAAVPQNSWTFVNKWITVHITFHPRLLYSCPIGCASLISRHLTWLYIVH